MVTREIERYLLELQKDEVEFKDKNGSMSGNAASQSQKEIFRPLKLLIFIFRSWSDYLSLLLKLKLSPEAFSGKRFIFTARNLCTENDGDLEDRIVKPLFTDDMVFINHSKEYYLKRINGQKVYNVGGVVKLHSFIRNRGLSRLMRIFFAYRRINDSIIKLLDGNKVFTLCYYDLNGLSLAFSSYRKNMVLAEVQHGSIINYPPYVKPSPIQIADIFYVKNRPTIEYLKSHLNKNFDPDYELIPYPKGDREYVPGLHVFYASTVEFNGLHPVFKEFLADNKNAELHVIVRLHPREREKELLFRDQLNEYDINFEFDSSKNWLDGNRIENLIVVSPWSSTIEDSYDNGFLTVVIDPVGRERYRHLIDNEQCYYSDHLSKTLEHIRRSEKVDFDENRSTV